MRRLNDLPKVTELVSDRVKTGAYLPWDTLMTIGISMLVPRRAKLDMFRERALSK